MLKVKALSAVPGVVHAFFTRNSSHSGDNDSDNNCGFSPKEDGNRIRKNRDACMARLNLNSDILASLRQCHTATVVTVTKPWIYAEAPNADAMVSRTSGVALSILTADCAPILLADSSSNVIAAAHAGWRGALGGVIDNVVDAMTALGATPQNTVAAIGPCIAQASYEVGAEFVDRFINADDRYADYFVESSRKNHNMFDLPGFIIDRLTANGVGTVVAPIWNTCAADELFFSYRRSVLKHAPDHGRQLSVIALA